MEMVLKESARMHPALALSLPEKTVKSVTELGGYQIPKGVSKQGRLYLQRTVGCLGQHKLIPQLIH
jgi:hypothetical protein